MRRLTPIERTVELFAERVSHWNVDQLKNIQRTLTQQMCKGRWTFGSYLEDEGVALYLKNRIASLARMKEEAGPSPEEQTEAEAQQLAKAHGVNVEIARRHVARKHIKDAPPVEPAPTPFDKRAELHAYYQSQNVPRNTEKAEATSGSEE